MAVHLKFDLAERMVAVSFSSILKFSGKTGVVCQKLRERKNPFFLKDVLVRLNFTDHVPISNADRLECFPSSGCFPPEPIAAAAATAAAEDPFKAELDGFLGLRFLV